MAFVRGYCYNIQKSVVVQNFHSNEAQTSVGMKETFSFSPSILLNDCSNVLACLTARDNGVTSILPKKHL